MPASRRLPTFLTSVVLALTIGGSGASAVISPGDYHAEQITLTLPHVAQAGSYLDCPAGQRPISGGTYWHRPGEAPSHTLRAFVIASAPTDDGKLWFGGGYNLASETLKLTIVTLCLPTSTIGTTRMVRSFIEVPESEHRGVEVSCPAGTKVLSGGAFFGKDATPIPDMTTSARVKSSSVRSDGSTWYANGRNTSPVRNEHLYVMALCAPPSVTGAYTSSVSRRHVRGGQTAASTASCPTGKRVVTGGAVWQRPSFGNDASLDVSLMGSAPALNGQAWTAWGRNNEIGELLLITTALCLPA